MEKGLVCDLATDPVCGASFDGDKAAAQFDFKGLTYYFCSEVCRDKFAEAFLS
jgi:Cu+-exporting ATPase